MGTVPLFPRGASRIPPGVRCQAPSRTRRFHGSPGSGTTELGNCGNDCDCKSPGAFAGPAQPPKGLKARGKFFRAACSSASLG